MPKTSKTKATKALAIMFLFGLFIGLIPSIVLYILTIIHSDPMERLKELNDKCLDNGIEELKVYRQYTIKRFKYNPKNYSLTHYRETVNITFWLISSAPCHDGGCCSFSLWAIFDNGTKVPVAGCYKYDCGADNEELLRLFLDGEEYLIEQK